MEKIIVYNPDFEKQIQKIVDVLFDEEYFGYIEFAIDYVNRIYDFIFQNINKPISKPTPKKFKKFGKYYIKYKANNRTFWYIFFDKKDNQYLVNYILNNHSQDFPDLI